MRVLDKTKKILDIIYQDDQPNRQPETAHPASPRTFIRTGNQSETKSMEPKQEEKRRKPSRAELEVKVSEFRELIGDKFRDHKDGDAEELLLKSYRRRGSHADH